MHYTKAGRRSSQHCSSLQAHLRLPRGSRSHGPLNTRYVVHNGALMPAEVVLVIVFAGLAVPARFAALSTRLGNSALSIFAIHVPIFLVLMKVLKLLSIGKSPLWCAAHFSECRRGVERSHT